LKRMDNPNGMNDRLIEESRILNNMENSICKSLNLCGFDKISTPVIEYYDAFSKKEFSFDEDSIYKFIDRGGSIMTLRPDMTIPCARVAATKMKNYSKPLKLCYSGNVYRVVGEGSSTRCEQNQIGAEIYGESGLWADIEIITTCCQCIKRSGINDFKIDIGHGDFFEEISKSVGLSEKVADKLKKMINDKNMVELQNMIEVLDVNENDKQLLMKLPHLFGSPVQIFSELENYELDLKVQETIDYLKLIFEKLEASPYKNNINIDMSMSSGMKYYTGIIFKGYAKGAAGVILSGGRYDTLTSIFNVDYQAVGFALYMDQVFSAYKNQNVMTTKVEKSLIVFDDKNYDKAFRFVEKIRAEQKIGSLIYVKSLSDEVAYMKDYSFTNIVRFLEGEDEAKC